MNLNFKKFIVEYEKNNDPLTGLHSSLGIRPEDTEGMPEISGNLSIGNFLYNNFVFEYKVLRDRNGQITGALIKQTIPPKKTYSKNPDKDWVVNPNPAKMDWTYVSKEDFMKLYMPHIKPPEQPQSEAKIKEVGTSTASVAAYPQRVIFGSFNNFLKKKKKK